MYVLSTAMRPDLSSSGLDGVSVLTSGERDSLLRQRQQRILLLFSQYSLLLIYLPLFPLYVCV